MAITMAQLKKKIQERIDTLEQNAGTDDQFDHDRHVLLELETVLEWIDT